MEEKVEERSDFGVSAALERVASAYYADGDSEELDHIAEAVVMPDEDVDDVLDRLSLEEIYERRRTLQGVVKATKAIIDRVDEYLAERLGPTGFVRYGEEFLSVQTKTRLRCVDREGLREYLGEKWTDCFDVNYPRKTAMKAVAKERGDSEGVPLELFYVEEVAGNPKLSVAPVDRLKWTQALKHGELGGGAGG